ncbi:MAG: rhomboid family intramembrane serine protease [Gemmatimonadales bacterium]|nr:rhomboid family intramembrane serine protease [Gemmatimonadales bacterium]
MYFFYFYPMGLDRKRTRPPVLSWSLTALMVVSFVWVRYFPDLGPLRPWDLVFFPGNGAPWTAVTAMFLHGGWLHLLGNLVYFHVFAPPLEDRLGPLPFIVCLLVIGVFGNLVHGLVSLMGWLGQEGMGVLGASGAIAGLLAFSMVRFYDSRVEVGWWVFAPLGGQNKAGRTKVPISAAAGLWLLLQVVQALASTESGVSVSFGAHFGGFVMGLLLALGLGQLRQGRAESSRIRAEGYFRKGQFHAAVGEWTDFLERIPGDISGKLGLARALQFSGQLGEARHYYHGLFDGFLAKGNIKKALEIYYEAGRGLGGDCFGPDALARVAYYHEKQMDYAAAVQALRQLHESYSEHTHGQRALVRIIVLYQGKLGDPEAARWWFQEACRKMPAGAWRDYLEKEISSPAVLCGEEKEFLLEPFHVPGS